MYIIFTSTFCGFGLKYCIVLYVKRPSLFCHSQRQSQDREAFPLCLACVRAL